MSSRVLSHLVSFDDVPNNLGKSKIRLAVESIGKNVKNVIGVLELKKIK